MVGVPRGKKLAVNGRTQTHELQTYILTLLDAFLVSTEPNDVGRFRTLMFRYREHLGVSPEQTKTVIFAIKSRVYEIRSKMTIIAFWVKKGQPGCGNRPVILQTSTGQ